MTARVKIWILKRPLARARRQNEPDNPKTLRVGPALKRIYAKFIKTAFVNAIIVER